MEVLPPKAESKFTYAMSRIILPNVLEKAPYSDPFSAIPRLILTYILAAS